MNNLEIELIQEYKRLDLLLKDMFNSEDGVSEYISRMENMASASSVVSDWDRDFAMLKRVRHIRNKIMHDEGDSFCEEDDIDYIVDFYDRLLDQDDPLAKLRKYRKEIRKAPCQSRFNEHEKQIDNYDYYASNNHRIILIILVAVLIIALPLLIFTLILSLSLK